MTCARSSGSSTVTATVPLADYIIVKESSLFELPDGLSYEKAALVEPFSVALHAVENCWRRRG